MTQEQEEKYLEELAQKDMEEREWEREIKFHSLLYCQDNPDNYYEI